MTGPGRSISDDIEETINALTALQETGRARRADMLAQLKAVVARLDAPGLPDEEQPEIQRPDRDDERRGPAQGNEAIVGPGPRQPAPYDFGPKVREKLRRIALGEER